uniref:RecA family profile 1 domain-containing protein n=1 Tax=Monopterus albus TaxID=43700 RepID=A0A3Q3QSJ2_MONAL
MFPENGGPRKVHLIASILCGNVCICNTGVCVSGKTELLYHFLCRCILPQAAGGLETDVMFVDTDYSLDMLRLVGILDSRLNRDEAALYSCLSRLLVVHCSSTSHLLLTLHFLETSLASRPSLSFLLIDSISAFYWPDRCEGGASIAKQEEKLGKCSDLLGRLLRDYRITVFATCHAIRSCRPSSAAASTESDRPYLCRPWQRLVTHRLLCSQQEVADNMTVAVGQQVFTVHCTSSFSTRTKAYRSNSFYVLDGGVTFI